VLEQLADRVATAVTELVVLNLGGILRGKRRWPMLTGACLGSCAPGYFLVSGCTKGDGIVQLDMVRRRSTVRFRNGAQLM